MHPSHFRICLLYIVLAFVIVGWSQVERFWRGLPSDLNPDIPLEELSGTQRRVLGLRIPLNSATPKDLESLPGIGPGMAKKIVRWREIHGPFEFPEDVQKVPGIGPKTYRGLQSLVEAGPGSQ